MIIGIDEAGRGAWAGPLVVCAAGLPNPAPAGVNDSKQLSAASRQRLAQSLRIGAQRAVSQLRVVPTEIIIDGAVNFLPELSFSRVRIRADQTVEPVMAASILAKVKRDEWMMNLAKRYPEYGFERHKGYGTAVHREAIMKHGVIAAHRQSFRPLSGMAR